MPPPPWLYLPVMTGLFIVNAVCAALFLRDRRQSGAPWWIGASTIGALFAAQGIVTYAPLPAEWDAPRALARNLLGDAGLVVLAVWFAGFVAMWIRRRPMRFWTDDNLAMEPRGIAMGGFYLSTILAGSEAKSPLGIALAGVAAVLLLLMLPLLWIEVRKPRHAQAVEDE